MNTRTIMIQTAGHALISFVSILLLPFLTLYMYDRLEENLALATLIIGIQPLTEILFTLLMGGWIDRFGRRPVLLGSLLFQLTAMIGFIMAADVWAFAVCAFINGLGRFVYIPAARAQISETVPPEKQTQTFALLQTGANIGALAGPFAGAALFSRHPPLLFGLMAVLTAVYAFIVWRWLPESRADGHTKKSDPGTISYKNLTFLACAMLPISLFHAQMETNWPVYLKETIEHYLWTFSVLETISTLTFICFEVLLVRWTESWQRLRVIQAGWLFYTAAAFGFACSPHFFGFIVSQLLFCFGAILTLNPMQTFISSIAPEAHKGRYFAWFGLHWDFSRSAGPFAGGLFLSHFGGGWLFSTLGVLLILGGVLQTKNLTTSARSPSSRKAG
ncbi:MFS transporter [Halobacillus halophilus]|uniref:MDR family MFS transporter n=1 Tax=Halobacillus halophilus TaxID=1570 RepID=UPI00136FCD86|nr:MFS transporter [Halobacillus halophilus]MYL30398.1 MFS transporter [Halobacillus halophilus]